MQPKTVTQSLIDRLHYWENELDVDRSAHPEPAQRLDAMIEQMIQDEAAALATNNDLRLQIAEQAKILTTLRKVIADQNESVAAVMARNKTLEKRWTTLRELLGIKNVHEESWE